MRTLIIVAIAIGLAHSATGAILKSLDNVQSYNKQTEQALITVAAK